MIGTTLLVFLGAIAAALAGALWAAYTALDQHRLYERVQARERAARKLRRLLRDRAELDFLMQALMIGGIALATAASLNLLPATTPRGMFLLAAVTLLELAAVQLGIRAGRRHADRLTAATVFVLQPIVRTLRPVLRAVLPGQPTDNPDSATPGALPASDNIRSLLAERTDLPPNRARMLRGVLDLDQLRVGEIMLPRAEITGVDLDADLEAIASTLRSCRHTRLPIFKGDINNVVGVLHIRDAHGFLTSDEPTRAELLAHTSEPFFVPAGSRCELALANLQREHRRLAFVVDEYGDVQGLVTVSDILEQIVGDFTTDFADGGADIVADGQGGYLVDASLLLREINRELGWQLPSAGPRTLNGLILEQLEFIPDANVGFEVDGYRVEIVSVRENAVRRARLTRAPDPLPAEDE